MKTINAARFVWTAALTTALTTMTVALPGCGSGGLGLTGGSIPIGTAVVEGRVVRADNIGQAVPGADLALSLTPTQRATQSSDSNGAFAFRDIKGGDFLCEAAGPSNSGLISNWRWPFVLPEGGRAQLIVSLYPQYFDPSAVQKVTIVPSSATTVHVGQTIQFVAMAKDANGASLLMKPSMALIGSIGTLDSNGNFTAQTVGQGTLTAWIRDHQIAIPVNVTP